MLSRNKWSQLVYMPYSIDWINIYMYKKGGPKLTHFTKQNDFCVTEFKTLYHPLYVLSLFRWNKLKKKSWLRYRVSVLIRTNSNSNGPAYSDTRHMTKLLMTL